MEKEINFSSIGFEIGQSKNGLSFSAENVRKNFPSLSLKGINLIDQGDALAQELEDQVRILSNEDLPKIQWEKYRYVYLKTLKLLEDPNPLLNWGGDHSVAISTVGAFCFHHPNGYVIWIDAHADLNLPNESLTGNLHGMPLSILMNIEGIASTHFKWLRKTLDPQKLIYIGLRDLDPFEVNLIKSLNIKAYFASDVLEMGMDSIAEQILEITKGYPLHISFDIDSLDPEFAPSTGVPVEHGLTPEHLYTLSEKLFQKSKIRSMDIVEVNPALGTEAQVQQTYSIAFNFLLSAFKKHHGDINEFSGHRNQREQFTFNQWDF
jgi:arginase